MAKTAAEIWLDVQAKPFQPLLNSKRQWQLLNGLLIIAQCFVLAKIFSSIIIDGSMLSALLPDLVLLLGLIVLRTATHLISEEKGIDLSKKAKSAIRQQLLTHGQQLGALRLEKSGSAQLTQLLNDGVESLEAYFAKYLSQKKLIQYLPLLMIIAVLPIDIWSALLFFLTLPLLPLFMYLIGKRTEQLNQEQWQQLQRLGGHFLDVIQGLTTLKLFNASRGQAIVLQEISNHYRQSTMKVLRMAFLTSATLEFFASVSIALIAVMMGFRLLYGEATLEQAFFVLLLAPEFFAPLRQMGSLNHAKIEAEAAATEMVAFLSQTAPAPKISITIPEENQKTASNIPLAVKNLAYRHHETAPWLFQNLSFSVNTGQSLAIVGKSGIGKSSLFSLLLGFTQPDTGKIFIQGHDVEGISLSERRQYLSWLPQQPRLFSLNVLENITMQPPEATDFSRLQQVLEQVQLSAWVKTLPQGLETVLGESGLGVSGGQKQRLALARALYKNAPILLLDEPTASIDPETEKLIEAMLSALKGEKTLLFIAHRPALLKAADNTLELTGGGQFKLT
jgi:ATP-binding cassette subfamily C protein CydD